MHALLVLGFPRAVVLLPATRFLALRPSEQRMALAHEFLHLRRGDPLLGYVPALAERLFFFHPLVRIAVREYQLTREAACDAAVVRELGAPAVDYGRLLLALGVSRMAPGLAAAGTSSSHSHLKRRITMLRDVSRKSTGLRKLAWITALLAACAIVPVEFVAQAGPQEPAPASTPRAQAAEPQPAPAATPGHPTHAVAPRPATHPAAAVAARPAPHPAAAAVPVQARASRASTRTREFSYVLSIDGNRMMSGSEDDVRRAEGFRRAGEQMLWFGRGGREYISRDPAVIKASSGAVSARGTDRRRDG